MFLLPAGSIEPEAAIKLCRGIIEKHNCEVLVAKKWDERRLAYEIGKHKRGLYIVTFFKGPGSSVAQIDRDVRLSESFIRVMITEADHLAVEEMEAVEPQPIQVREERPQGAGMGGFGGYGGGYGGYSDRPERSDRGGRRRDDMDLEV